MQSTLGSWIPWAISKHKVTRIHPNFSVILFFGPFPSFQFLLTNNSSFPYFITCSVVDSKHSHLHWLHPFCFVFPLHGLFAFHFFIVGDKFAIPICFLKYPSASAPQVSFFLIEICRFWHWISSGSSVSVFPNAHLIWLLMLEGFCWLSYGLHAHGKTSIWFLSFLAYILCFSLLGFL